MPEFLSTWVWADYCIKNLKPDQHMIFDGSPRRVQEALMVDSALTFYKKGTVHVIYMNVSEKVAVARLTARKRQDDNVDDIKARMAWFPRDVLPTIEYYKNNNRYAFHEINGELSPEDVHKAILSSIK